MNYHNVQSPSATIKVSVVVAETNDEKIYDMRKLMGAAFRKASANTQQESKNQ